MLLPAHLMDYVVLHELAHTREMNHGPRFWELLDRMTEGRALALRKELRAYRRCLSLLCLAVMYVKKCVCFVFQPFMFDEFPLPLHPF